MFSRLMAPASPTSDTVMEFKEGQVVRLRKLKLLQKAYEGTLCAVQEHLVDKGVYKVVTPSGTVIEVPPTSMKLLDSPSLYSTGEIVRLRNLGMLNQKYEGQLAAVQEYLPKEDTWKVTTNNGDKLQLTASHLKKIDSPTLFKTGDLTRIIAGDHQGEVVVIKEYLDRKDKWLIVRGQTTGSQLEVCSTQIKNVTPTLFHPGDEVTVGIETGKIEDYDSFSDKYRIQMSDGSIKEAFSENIQSGTTGTSFEGLATLGNKQSSGGIFSKFKTKIWSGAPTPDQLKGAFQPGDQIHMVGYLTQKDGMMALLKNYSESKQKWEAILYSTSETIEIAAKNMRPMITQPDKYVDGTPGTVMACGTRAVVQSIDVDKGLITVRTDAGKKQKLYSDQFLLDCDVLAAQTAAATTSSQKRPQLGENELILVDELLTLLESVGTTLEEARGFSESDLDELLRDELKLSVIKRNRMKNIIRSDYVPPRACPPIASYEAKEHESNQDYFSSPPPEVGEVAKKAGDPFEFLAE
eukprot:TRINITY_DN1869_c3_g1_i2.p1 TRINITY_DN1869_c3_g1~~TRINITY_DN1869_c3_g1_i2.p1  ORF type:complete len:558 (+),score=117.48 TRINITY_DN1869_c3_g1_i2:112-1674(+)